MTELIVGRVAVAQLGYTTKIGLFIGVITSAFQCIAGVSNSLIQKCFDRKLFSREQHDIKSFYIIPIFNCQEARLLYPGTHRVRRKRQYASFARARKPPLQTC